MFDQSCVPRTHETDIHAATSILEPRLLGRDDINQRPDGRDPDSATLLPGYEALGRPRSPLHPHRILERPHEADRQEAEEQHRRCRD